MAAAKNKFHYNQIASGYDNRYSHNKMSGIENELSIIAAENKFRNVIEIGCGSGRWISNLLQNSINVVGLDYSITMLQNAKIKCPHNKFICADAVNLPIKAGLFDWVYCVNSIHHFNDYKMFLNSAKNILSQNGVITIAGLDPSDIENEWYVYDYFEGVKETDLNRYPRFSSLISFLQKENFEIISFSTAENISHQFSGNSVFEDNFLIKDQTSQLAALTTEEYSNGISKLEDVIKENSHIKFTTNLKIQILTAIKI